MQKENEMIITPNMLERFRQALVERELSSSTIGKYMHDVKVMMEFAGGRPLTKEILIMYKEQLARDYAAVSVNSMLAAANSFLEFIGHGELRLRLLKIQRASFCAVERELSREEYGRLIRAAERKKDEKLSLIVQTICATGIRVSELRFITAEAVSSGRAEIVCKGKRRTVFLPRTLTELLNGYLTRHGIRSGPVFATRTGRPLDRSNVWREMKKLSEYAGVAAKKVFPHNLRHLFARTFYSVEKDLSRLADILGHSDLATTRIYTMESGDIHARQIERLGLVLTT